MKWISLLGAALTLFTATESAHAFLTDSCCGSLRISCAESCQLERCLPTVSRPCRRNIYCYQRTNSHVKASCCAPPSCGAEATCCAPIRSESSCLQSTNCSSGLCAVSVENSCCAPISSCGPAECEQGSYCISAGSDGCVTKGCCDASICQEIAALIYQSMTECYATARRTAIHRLGDRYDCCEHPEIMNAFIYALNDSDERVRAKAGDEIGDQIRRNRCCCGMPVIRALQEALADCDRSVRRQAEEALELSGYAIVSRSCSCSAGKCCSAAEAIASPQGDVPGTAMAKPIVPVPVPAESGEQAVASTSSHKIVNEATQGSNSTPTHSAAVEPRIQPAQDSPAYFKARLHKTFKTIAESRSAGFFHFGR